MFAPLRNVSLLKTACLGEERCVTTQSTAVLQTNNSQNEIRSHFEIKPHQCCKLI